MDNTKLANSMRELLERPARSAIEQPVEARQSCATSDEEYSAFANGRIGNRPQLSLVFRKASGAALGFSYTHFSCIESENPDVGFVVTFSAGKSVTVQGRNLSQLFNSICLHKAAEIVEATRGDMLEVRNSGPLVASIVLPGEAPRSKR